MSNYFSTKSYQSPAVYINIRGVQLGLSQVKYVDYDITSLERPITPKSLTTFPNLIVSLEAEKLIDGGANKYTLVLKYLPQEGEDPSYIDKLISSARTHDKGKIIIAYGDGSSDGFFLTKQEAMIATYKLKVDLDTSALTYTISAISSSGYQELNSKNGSNIITYEFADRKNQYPTVIMQELYKNPIYGLKDLFPGGIYLDGISIDKISDDSRPDGKHNDYVITGGSMSPIEYIKYLVKSMYPKTIGTEEAGYSYVYSFDDTEGLQSFHIDKATGRSDEIIDTVKIGVQDSPVVSYEFESDYSYALAVSYGEKAGPESCTKVRIDSTGKETREVVSGKNKTTNEGVVDIDQLWWDTISNIPFSMSMVVRSLKKSLPIMSNIRVIVVVKGQEHWISGTFYVIKIVDKVDKNGFVSEINLLKKPVKR